MTSTQALTHTHAHYIYIWILTMSFSSSLKNLEDFIADIRPWMTQTLLRPNVNKTNIIYLASPHCVKSLTTQHYRWVKSSITLNGSVIYIGIIFDQCINYYLKKIHCLKALLTQETRIDYCNSLLYGITYYNINRLQRIKNSAACIVTNTRKYHNITPILQKNSCYQVISRY